MSVDSGMTYWTATERSVQRRRAQIQSTSRSQLLSVRIAGAYLRVSPETHGSVQSMQRVESNLTAFFILHSMVPAADRRTEGIKCVVCIWCEMHLKKYISFSEATPSINQNFFILFKYELKKKKSKGRHQHLDSHSVRRSPPC